MNTTTPLCASSQVPPSAPVLTQDALLVADIEARLANEMIRLGNALCLFNQTVASISKELPDSAHFGKHITALLTQYTFEISHVPFELSKLALLTCSEPDQIHHLQTQLNQLGREIALDGLRFLAIPLIDQRTHQLTQN